MAISPRPSSALGFTAPCGTPWPPLPGVVGVVSGGSRLRRSRLGRSRRLRLGRGLGRLRGRRLGRRSPRSSVVGRLLLRLVAGRRSRPRRGCAGGRCPPRACCGRRQSVGQLGRALLELREACPPRGRRSAAGAAAAWPRAGPHAGLAPRRAGILPPSSSPPQPAASSRRRSRAAVLLTQARLTDRSRGAATGPSGRPACSMAWAASSIGYSTRRQLAVHALEVEQQPCRARVAVAGLAHAAGVDQPVALRQVELACRRRRARRPPRRSSARLKQSATCEWPDGAHARAPSCPCTRRPAWWRARTPRPGRAGWRGRARAARSSPLARARRGTRATPWRCCSRRPGGGDGGVEREVGDVEPVDHHEVVVADQAELAAPPGRARRTRRAGRRSRPGRRGTSARPRRAADVRQHRLERGQVAVDVREQRDPDRRQSLSTVSGEWRGHRYRAAACGRDGRRRGRRGDARRFGPGAA